MSVALAVAVLARASASQVAYSCDSGGSCGSSSGEGGGGCSSSDPYLSVPDRLYSTAASSSSDVWAVGMQPSTRLIMHWDGYCWTVTDTGDGYLQGVSAVSSSDAWAVGGTSWWNPSHTLALHWDGSSWSTVDTPNEGGSAVFAGVAATSGSNAWAVGDIGPGPGDPAVASPLIEHWDGTAWSAQSFQVPTSGGILTGVAATSADDAWAVGHTGGVSEGSGQETLIEHWDGSSWTRISSPDPTGDGNTLQNVTAISAEDAWAVGYTFTSSAYEPLILHWDGSSWSKVTSPDPASDTNLWGITAASADDVWATGYTGPCSGGHAGGACQTVAMHWDGSSWTVTSTVDPSGSSMSALLGVVAVGGDDVWAVGTNEWSDTLIEHWDGSSWRD